MSSRNAMLGLVGLVGLSGLVAGCGEALSAPEEAPRFGSAVQAVSANAQGALDWANGWTKDVVDDSTKLAENRYASTDTALVRAVGTTQAKNRTVCGTLVTQLFQKSLGLTSNDFYNSFNKAMDSCTAGSGKGTNSPNARQYLYKIKNCGATGPVKFAKHEKRADIQLGDVLAVSFPERTDISGHVMIVRSLPVADPALPAGPANSTAYAVEIVDSTSTPHGSAAGYPDWRGGNTGQGLGHGTFVVYTNASDDIVASRWSPSEPDLYDTTAHPIAVGGLQ